jgi:hypothetical protein
MKRLLSVLAMLFALAGVARAGEPNVSVGSAAYEGSHVLKAKGGSVYILTVNYHTAAYRTVMLFDATVLPANGAVTACASTMPHTTGCLLWCFEGDGSATAAAESFTAKSWTTAPIPFSNGLVVAASVSTSGCGSLTVDSANEWFNAQIDAQ